ncbi:protein rotatin homolog [Phlebotomus argentipes]|uniref:protein rotatin homolog n=1 Tax=Phlebotomus argentipes TaxID=94469 RepID=UPI00289339FF|nr:protein rotatin homolog [Phlebotomus argentipes]
MEISISPQIVEKLNHSIEEIRVRALKNVEGKVGKALQCGYEIRFHGVDLIKALLKWFSQDVLSHEDVALNIIFLMLSSKYGPDIVNHLTKSFLRKELAKIGTVLKQEIHLTLLEDIGSAVEQVQEIVAIIDLTDDLPSLMEDLCVEEVPLTPREYVKCWSVPNAIDQKSLKNLKDSLESGSLESRNHALDFLSMAIEDYPAEFFLQPPYLVITFQELLSEGRDLKTVLWKFNRILFKRIHMLASSAAYTPPESEASPGIFTQIAVSKYCGDAFNLLNGLLKGTEDQVTINWCFEIFDQLVNLLVIDDQRLLATGEMMLRELGLLAKFFRNCLGFKIQDFTARKMYIKVLQLIVKLRKIPGYGREEISGQELSIARLDVAVKTCYPKIYRSIEAACPELEKRVEILLNCEQILRPAIFLLRPMFRFTDDELCYTGVAFLETSNLHKSMQMTAKLIEAVANCVVESPGNNILMYSAEKIMLQLLAHPCLKIKQLTYQKSTEKMKFFVSSLAGGEQIMSKRGFLGDNLFKHLGIPLSKAILIEITAFGCTHEDPIIHSSAEAMLLFVLQSRVILKEHWNVLKEVLFPVLPLLQCLTTKSSKLGQAILSLLHPDGEFTSAQEVVESTVRFLFCPDPSVRDEAVSRILYSVNNFSKSEAFIPKISHIADTVANDLIIVDYQVDMAARFKADSHQEAFVDSLLGILKADNVEPSVRKNTVMQLNLLAMDPNVNEHLVESQGWMTIAEVLDNCFKVGQTKDFVEICIPAIGIFSKILLHSPLLRQNLSDEINVYFIVLRSLLMFQHDANLKADAATSLFLLAFSGYTVGSYSISVPRIMKRLKIPFLPQFHWTESPHKSLSPLEDIFQEEDVDSAAERELFWQILRISFANVWFDGLENMLANMRQPKRDGGDEQRLDYKYVSEKRRMPMVGELDFDDCLRLTKKDLLLIHSSLPMDSFRYFIHHIENSTTHQEMTSAIAHIKCNLTLDAERKFPMESLLAVLKKYCLTPPTLPEDVELFGKILNLLQTMLDHDEGGKVKDWLEDQLKISNSVFTSVFMAPAIPLGVYEENTKLLIKFFEFFTRIERGSVKEKNFLGKIFRCVLKALEKCLEQETQMNRARVLISLLNCLICTTSLECEIESQLINRIFRYAASTKSLCQGGSKFILNCLLSIRGLLEKADMHQVAIKPKYFRYISGLCSHTDVWIRQASWMILRKAAEDFSAAHVLIDELKFLPGGFHACCIVTVLDEREGGCVREVAAQTFRNLVSHRSGQIALQVSPRCSEYEIEGSSAAEPLIMMIVKKQKVTEGIVKQLSHFYIWDAVLEAEEGSLLTNANTVNGFCVLLMSVIEIDESFIDVLMEENCLQNLANILAMVPMNPSMSVLQMAAAICNLLIQCLQHSDEILQSIVGQNQASISALLFLQDDQLYADEEQLQDMAVVFLKMLSVFGTSPVGFHIVTSLMQERNAEKIFSLLVAGFKIEASREFQQAALDFLSTYLKMGVTQENANFLHLMDPASDAASVQEDEENQDPNAVSDRECAKTAGGEKVMVTVIFNRIQKLFETLCARDKPEIASFRACNVMRCTGKTLAVLLKCSSTARSLAACSELLLFVLKRLGALSGFLGNSAADFVRRNGELKKKFIVDELMLMTDILCGWFEVDKLNSPDDVNAICRLMLKLWSWSGSSAHLQMNFYLLIKHLSEQSYLFCCCVSKNVSGSSDTILQLIISAAVQETNRAKQQEVKIAKLSVLLRVLSNCCASIDGRLLMLKLGVLDNISQFHPAVTRTQRPQRHVIELWLAFYEIFSRHPEGSGAKHLTVLCALVAQKQSGVRRKAVEILRNFALSDSNIAALLTSTDFVQTTKSILDGSDREDQLNIAVAIWSIIANNHRATNAIKTSSIPGKINKIQNQLILDNATNSQLCQTLEDITKILNK